jgi:hypothetical protein
VIKITDFDDFVTKLSNSLHTVEMQWHLTKKNKDSFLKITLQKGEESKISSTYWTAIDLVKEPIKSELHFTIGKQLCFIGDLSGPKNILQDSIKMEKDIKFLYTINPRDRVKIQLKVSLVDCEYSHQEYTCEVFILHSEMNETLEQAIGIGPYEKENSVAEVVLPKELAPNLSRFFPKDSVV